MSQKSGNSEHGSLGSKIEAVQSLAQRLLEAIKILPETHENAQLLPLIEKLNSSDFAGMLYLASEKNSETESATRLARLRQELELKDQKIYEFKISLADSVIEFRNTQKELLSARENNSALTSQVTQMQLHSKDISLKLSSALAALDARAAELEATQKELMELRSRSYQLKSANAEYEDHLQKAATDLEQLQRVHNTACAQNEKALGDFQHVVTSNKELKQALELLEIKEKELLETIDSLQKERNHLQSRLNTLLIGVNKRVDYHQHLSASSDSSLLEPAILQPYLPFCFPERLPAAIKFRREIRRTFPAEFSRRPAPAPHIFINQKAISPKTETLRIAAKRPRIKAPLKGSMQLAYSRIQPDIQSFVFSQIKQQHKASSTILWKQDSLIPAIVGETPVWLRNTGREGNKMLGTNGKLSFAISTHSPDLYLNFLTKTITRQNFNPSENPLPLVFRQVKISNFPVRLNFSNTLNEMLAFRHRFQLKSQKLNAPRVTLTHSFKSGFKLKSVLEMFGNAINLMVQKYEIIPTSQTGSGENVK